MDRTPSAVGMLFAAIALGLATAWLFVGQILGVNGPIVMLLFFLAIGTIGASARVKPCPGDLLLIAVTLAITAATAIRSNGLLTLMNVLAILGLAALIVAIYGRQHIHRLTAAGYPWAGITTAVAATGQIIPVASRANQDHRDGRSKGAIAVGRGLIIALPILCVFTALFASADRAFNNIVSDLFNIVDLDDLISRIFLAGFVAWGVAGMIDHALTGKLFNANPTLPATPGRLFWQRLPFTEWLVVMALIDALFVVFVVVQLRYFFLAEDDLSIRGIGYADYAREGFFQLLFAAFLTLVLVSTLDLVARRVTRSQHTTFAVLAVVMVACAFVMLVSSFRRLYLYELEFGFTQDRIFSHAMTIWLAAVFVLFLVALLGDRRAILPPGLLVAMIAFVVGLNLFNPDAFIVDQNMRRFDAGKPLDTRHLGTLSDDAMPLVVAAFDRLPTREKEQLAIFLARRLSTLDAQRDQYGWPSAHLAREAAFVAIDARRSELPEPYSR